MFTQLNNNKKVKSVSAVLVALMLFLCLSMLLTGCVDNNKNKNDLVVDSNTIQDKVYELPKNMSFSSETLALANFGEGLTIKVEAFIFPLDATNKKVDWSVAWADGSTDKVVTEYVNVVAESDGSTIANITCYKPFEKNIKLTVTTRQKEKKAYSNIRFVGKPQTLDIESLDGYVLENNTYNIPVGEEVCFKITQNNAIDFVSDDYKEIGLTINAVGTVILGTLRTKPSYFSYDYPSGFWNSNYPYKKVQFLYPNLNYTWDESGKNVKLSEIINEILSYRIENDLLYLKMNCSINDYHKSFKVLGDTAIWEDAVYTSQNCKISIALYNEKCVAETGFSVAYKEFSIVTDFVSEVFLPPSDLVF